MSRKKRTKKDNLPRKYFLKSTDFREGEGKWDRGTLLQGLGTGLGCGGDYQRECG
jgi:hypothetical protein